jgi:hypothetical protein
LPGNYSKEGRQADRQAHRSYSYIWPHIIVPLKGCLDKHIQNFSDSTLLKYEVMYIGNYYKVGYVEDGNSKLPPKHFCN